MMRFVALVVLLVLFIPLGNVFASGTTDLTTGGTVIYDNEDAGYPASNTVDDNQSTFYQTDHYPCNNHYIGYSWASGYAVDKYTIRIANSTVKTPTSWNFQGSNNGSSWTTLDSQSSITWSTNYQIQTFTFTNTTIYTYYRWYWLSCTDGNRVLLSEVELFEADPPTAIPTNTATATQTDTPTITPTATSTMTPTYTYTPTETFTPTQTYTPTATRTPAPTFTPWPTNTATPTDTGTPRPATYTPGPTFTPGGPTSTPTNTPYASLIWAKGLFDILPEEQVVMETLLLDAPPPGASSRIYAVTDYQTVSSGISWISVVNLTDVSSPYNTWSAEDNSTWAGSIIVDITADPIAYYYKAPAPMFPGHGVGGSVPVILWPYGGGAATYSQGIHTAYGMPGIDIAPDGGPYAYAVDSGTVTFICSSSFDEAIKIETASGIYLYMHLISGSVANGAYFAQGALIGELVTSPFNNSSSPSCASYSTGTHIHFGFANTGYLQFEGCVLEISSSIFDCNGTRVFPGGRLPSAGGAIVVPTGDGTTTPTTPGGYVGNSGGEHIWDGLINAVSKIIHGQINKLPNHESIGIVSSIAQGAEEIAGLFIFFNSLGLLYIVPAMTIGALMLLLETVRLVISVYRWIVSLEPLK